MRVVLNHNRHDRHTSLNSQVESTLLERQQHRLIGVTPRALGENEHALAVSLHLIHGAVKGLHGSLAVCTVNKYSSGKSHEPAQEGDIAQRLLRRDTAVRREDLAQHEHIKLGLVVTNKDSRPGSEVLLALDDVELDAGGDTHHPLETAGSGPLGDTAIADEAEDDGGDHTVDRTQEQGAIGGETTSDKGGAGHFLAKSEERQGHHHKRADARQDVGTDRHGGITNGTVGTMWSAASKGMRAMIISYLITPE